MTDYPAIVYLKAQAPSKEVGSSINEEDKLENVGSIKKKIKRHKNSFRSRRRIESYKRLLEAMNDAVLKKMDKIDGRLDILSEDCDILEKKVDALSSLLDSNGSHCNEIMEKSTVDFPGGSWLGFENNPEMRVRCKISPKDLRELNKICVTPEKMALALLDHLFDRETQACSNISGLGKHKKKQLNPLLIYGIKCHLIYLFDINEEDWAKVKIHIDSKCGTIFRKKLKGMSISARKYFPSNADDVDSASQDSKHSYSSNVYSDKESVQSEENGNELKPIFQIILKKE